MQRRDADEDDVTPWKFLCRRAEGVGAPTHTIMTGGKHFLHPDDMTDFRKLIGANVDRGEEVPSISEMRTQLFPMYADVDLKVPAEALRREAVRAIADVLCRQLMKFYTTADLTPETFKCVVCVRSGRAELQPDRTRYKHGIHVHWPDLVVNVDQALQMQASFVAGLSAVDSWEDLLGTVRVDWPDAIDASAYNTGLRMAGCPKGMVCPQCRGRGKTSCDKCRNTRSVVDPRVYQACMVLQGGEEDAAACAAMARYAFKLLSATTVRVDERKVRTETPGYRVYAGCPAVIAPGGKKRKGKSDAEGTRLSAQVRRQEEITDPTVLRIVRQLLTRHDPVYQNAVIKVRRWKQSLTVTLSGDGARFCKNKGSEHNSQNVYMVVRNSGLTHSGYQSVMKCWCRCPTKERVFHRTCEDYYSPEPVSVEDADVRHLFPPAEEVAPHVPPQPVREDFDPTSVEAWNGHLALLLEKINRGAGAGRAASSSSHVS